MIREGQARLDGAHTRPDGGPMQGLREALLGLRRHISAMRGLARPEKVNIGLNRVILCLVT